MAETKCYIPNQLLDLDQIQQEAQHRWLRPAEICEILVNYQKFQLRSSPPALPPAGSLFLFDRKVIRYFRKDGHRWRKKKDGKIVKEAHEKLKAGSVDVLHCYYAHGEDNENFQRRSYWMLDKRFENIVLVHYRQVSEGNKTGFPRVNLDSRTMLQSSQSSEQTPHTSYTSDMNSLDNNINEHSVSSRLNNEHSPQDFVTDSFTTDLLSFKLTDAKLDSDSNSQDIFTSGNGFFPDSEVASQVKENSGAINFQDNDHGVLKKMDSFGRWMVKEMGEDFNDSLMTPDSSNYWNGIETENNKSEVLNLSDHITSPVGPSLAQEQLFSISDFAPDWAYSGTETKILIIGTFLGDKKRMSEIKWCCMFGEIEVAAEVVTENAIKCQVPSHVAGRIPFYITCSNRLACSEVREFEYIEKSTRLADYQILDKSWDEEEFGLVIRLSKLLSLGVKTNKWLDCKVVNCEKCKMKDVCGSILSNKEWGFKGNSKELLIKNLLKDKVYEWLVFEVHEECKGLRVLDEKGQGVIHLVGCLGYDWAVGPIITAGVSPNFRDSHGRTALHWASLYGREETVVALVKLGAFAGAVDDPTPVNPGGQTAADLASSKGHKGIAGYLAETDLTSHLSALSVNDNNNGDGTNSLKGSLGAVRRSVHAAALIQDAFRARSFNQRQHAKMEENEELAAITSFSNKFKKTVNYEDHLHVAASTIQHKYRGWKGRNDFLKTRERVIKIQAHFRGHKVRKHYKKVVWSVGIVEKAILRWRRKSRGLRGFRPELTSPESEYDFMRIGRKQKYVGVEKALARVQSMARNPEGQEQYMRLVVNFEKLSHDEDRSK